MSVFAGRVFMLVSALVTLICTVVAVLGIQAEWEGGFIGTAVAFATVGAVVLMMGLIVFPPYVETRIDRHRIELRYVFKPRRVIPVEDIDEIIVLQGLQIPGRLSSVTTTRVLLRGGGRALAAYSPRRRGAALQEVAPLGVEPHVDPEYLTPERAHRRYSGSVTYSERAMRPVSFLAVAVGLGAIVWGLATIL